MTFEVECIDRMYLNCYVPRLQYPGGLVGYVSERLGLRIPSTAPLADISHAFDAAIHRYARDNDVPWVDFKTPVTPPRSTRSQPHRAIFPQT